ncbi:MAG: CD1247 N-terminal domain-containing protein [Bacilli bacterium]|jgi:rubrerythrin
MEYIKEKVAYLQGLAEGLKIEESSSEGKVLYHIIDVLDDITDALDGLADAQYAAEEEAEEVQEILSDIVEFFDVLADDDDDEYEDDEDIYEVICPECGETYLADFESFEEDDVFCPNCGAPFKLEESVLEKLTHGDESEASDKDE